MADTPPQKSAFITRSEFTETVDEVILPAIENIVDMKNAEQEVRMEKSMEKRMRDIVKEEMQPVEKKLNKIMDILEHLVADVDDLKTEKTTGDYLLKTQKGTLESHEKQITSLDTRVTTIETNNS